MMNTTLYNELINRYNAVAYTHNYIFGFEYKKNIYMATTTKEAMPFVCTLDKASRGCGMALRFCPKVDQKVFLLTSSKPLCSAKYFNELCEEKYLNEKGEMTKYNRGEVFEKLVTEHFNQVWTKDNVPFTKDGDLTVDGTAYQIKFEKATFCNEKSIANLEK